MYHIKVCWLCILIFKLQVHITYNFNLYVITHKSQVKREKLYHMCCVLYVQRAEINLQMCSIEQRVRACALGPAFEQRAYASPVPRRSISALNRA